MSRGQNDPPTPAQTQTANLKINKFSLILQMSSLQITIPLPLLYSTVWYFFIHPSLKIMYVTHTTYIYIYIYIYTHTHTHNNTHESSYL